MSSMKVLPEPGLYREQACACPSCSSGSSGSFSFFGLFGSFGSIAERNEITQTKRHFVTNLLQEMKREKLIQVDGATRGAFWRLYKADENLPD